MSKERHILVVLMENRPGVLNRAVSLFRQRGFNLDSLTVGRTEQPEVSRMTLVLEGTDVAAERVMRELGRLVQVIRVEHLNGSQHFERDLALVKVAVTAETRQEVQHLCDIFRARVIDVSRTSLAVELTGDEEKIEGFVELLRGFGIIERVRTGLVAMGRGDNILDHHATRSSWIDRRTGTTPATATDGR
jgi:acetolactate synthase-1/3 small subunit